MRKIAIAPLLALVLSLPTAAPALAADSGGRDTARSGHSSAEDRSGHSEARRPGKLHRHRFAQIGTVTAVDQGVGTLTFTVRRGSSKALRGTALVVSVTAGTQIRRNGTAAGLGDLVAGDRVVVEGVRSETSYLALRVRARNAKAVPDDPEAPPTSPSPTPTDSPSDDLPSAV